MASKSELAVAELDARFVGEYLIDLNASAAARRVGITGTATRIATWGYRMMQRPEIRAAIERANAERMAAVKIEANEVLRSIHDTAFADPNEIMQVRRGCCRHCHGIEGKYQYVDQRELDRAKHAFEVSDEGLLEVFEHGGLGFDAKLDPNPECAACGGVGGVYVHVNDTRYLSPAARSLYAGAKQTKDGIEVKLHPQDKARELLMRHLGLLNDKLKIDTSDLDERILRARKRVGL